ncbi:MAG: hypothetical protein NTW73_01670 [Candidatus Parcubacteria bacterium]|nr:hypothetical protein [Candidatus Parcubacteria bacterium]
MVKIIPVINVKTKQDFEKRLRELKKYEGSIQVDVADGQFTSWKNFQDISEMKLLKIKKPIQLHLMVKRPEDSLQDWLILKPIKIFIHWEALKDFEKIYSMCLQTKTELGIALNPYTHLTEIEKVASKIKSLLLLGVDPGPSGQSFNYYVLEKIKEVKKKYPKMIIQLDGGVNEEIGKLAVLAGVDELATGSYIFKSDDPYQAILDLEKKII